MIVGEFLLNNMVSVSPVDDDSWTPLHHAALWKQVSISNDFPLYRSNCVNRLSVHNVHVELSYKL